MLHFSEILQTLETSDPEQASTYLASQKLSPEEKQFFEGFLSTAEQRALFQDNIEKFYDPERFFKKDTINRDKEPLPRMDEQTKQAIEDAHTLEEKKNIVQKC